MTDSLVAQGVPHAAASAQAFKIAQLQSGSTTDIPAFIRIDFADATRAVLYAMAVIMGLASVVALRGLKRGVQEAAETATTGVADQPPDESPRRRGRQGRAARPRRAWS